jgi:DNA polymerase IV (archaeal DinB-like DNA polymerase)
VFLERVIGHFDLDYFFAQVEEVQNPSIKGRPVVVCVFSGRTEESGVVSTANYTARALGVNSGLPIVLAKKKLQGKDAVVVRMDHEKYKSISSRVMQAVEERVDILGQTGIDEAFFDLTSSTKGDFKEAGLVAQGIKESIFRDEGLTCSIGLGRSKVVAKLGSDLAKPGGLNVVLPESTETFLAPLPVTKLYGVGPRTASALGELGVKTIGDLSAADPLNLEDRFGKKLAAYLLAASTGRDDSPVLGGLEPTQYSRIVTLKRDTRDPGEVLAQLSDGIDSIGAKLGAAAKSFRTVTAIGIFTDLSMHTKSKTFDTPVNNSSTIRESASGLFTELGLAVAMDFRRVGIRVSGLVDSEDQKSLSEFLHPAS